MDHTKARSTLKRGKFHEIREKASLVGIRDHFQQKMDESVPKASREGSFKILFYFSSFLVFIALLVKATCDD